MSELRTVVGGAVAPSGYRASGVAAGIKGPDKDVAVLASDRPCVVAGVFTTNRVQGATVGLCQSRVGTPGGRAVVINSGNANACNGQQGIDDADAMADAVAAALDLASEQVFVCSTGTIGIPMPMAKVLAGIDAAVDELSEDGGHDAAEAIMTTDTVPKQEAVEFQVDGLTVRVGGMAKGAGMIEPNMATMLAFLTTDADVDGTALQSCLGAAVAKSFNRISIDGDQSCNDTVLFMANGAAGNRRLGPGHPDWGTFVAAVDAVALGLAKKIVLDGEGATKFVTVRVTGAAGDADADLVARAVANSLLVKTSWFGCDPNWGRVIDAVGYSGGDVRQEGISIAFDDVWACRNGVAVSGALDALEKVMQNAAFEVNIEVGAGRGAAQVYTCDCSHEYVRINSEYMT